MEGVIEHRRVGAGTAEYPRWRRFPRQGNIDLPLDIGSGARMNESSAAAALGDLLEQMKRRSECSYVELARKTFTSSSTLHRYCAGRSVPPDAAVITRLAMACGAN